jgi:hypothetical protein
MTSQKQLEANRRNARRSTGPRTAAGKSVSSMNALRTGINAFADVLPDEDPAELDALAAEYEAHYRPSSPGERCCVASLVAADWRLRRFRKLEADLWKYESVTQDRKKRDNGVILWRCREPLALLQRRIDSADRAFHRAIQRLEKIRSVSATLAPAPASPIPPQPTDPQELAPPPESPNGFVRQFRVLATPPVSPESTDNDEPISAPSESRFSGADPLVGRRPPSVAFPGCSKRLLSPVAASVVNQKFASELLKSNWQA